MDKREPTLADRFTAEKYPQSKRIVDERTIVRVQQRVRQAHRYVLDEQAAARIGDVVRRVPELLLREHRFARAPFELTWVEFPHWRFWQVLTDGRPQVIEKPQDETSDHTIGYLFDHGRVNTVSGGTVGQPHKRYPYLTPFQYHLHTDWPVEDQIRFVQAVGSSRGQIDHYLWGATSTQLQPEHARVLRDNHRLDLLPLEAAFRSRIVSEPNLLDKAMRGGSGELRNMIAILLMLNRPTIARYRNVLPGARGWHRGKLIPYLSHTTVTVDIDAVPTLRMIGTPAGEGVPRRRHEVEGHYCHDVTARDFHRIAGCIHDWITCDDEWTPAPKIPDGEANHWRCSICDGKRWWRAEHLRGDATRGFVRADHAVTASRL
jgi:hypothetical protein